MTELESLLVGCVRWEDGQAAADLGSLCVVADWLEENRRESDAEMARSIVSRAVGSPSFILASLPEIPATGRRLARRVTIVARSLSPGRGWRDYTERSLEVVVEHNTVRRMNTERIEVLWHKVLPTPADEMHTVDELWPHYNIAKWHAILHVLGYTPHRLLACCAAGVASPA